MNYTLHKLPEGFIVTSHEYPTKKGELYYNTVNNQIRTLEGVVFNHCKKVIAQQDQIDFSALTEEEQKKIGWFDYSKWVDEFLNQEQDIRNRAMLSLAMRASFLKAQELLSDRRFTLEDISKTFVGEDVKGGLFDDFLDYRITTNEKITFKEWYLKQSLSQPKSWKAECIEKNGKIKILRIL